MTIRELGFGFDRQGRRFEWANEDPFEGCDDTGFVPRDLTERQSHEFLDTHPIEAFEAWVCDLDGASFSQICSALEVMHRMIHRYHAEKAVA